MLNACQSQTPQGNKVKEAMDGGGGGGGGISGVVGVESDLCSNVCEFKKQDELHI